MPLPGVDPAAADNAERALIAKVATAQVSVLERVVLRDVELALHERNQALATRDLLKLGAIEPARLAVREAQLQYEVGRSDLVSVITSRRELYDALERWTKAAIDVQRADAHLERFLLPESRQKGRR
jgi:outer membrane protein TolC